MTTALLLSASAFLLAQSPRLIVRGDDMGYTHSGNEALIKCFKEGIETSIEVIVPSPWFPEAAALLKENPGVDIGVHLALTSEWDLVKWRPLTNCPSLVNGDGYFFPMVTPNKNYPGQSIRENHWRLDEIEREFRAQIELALRKIPGVTHLSSHMGCTGLSDEVRALTKRLASEYKLAIDPADFGVVGLNYGGPSKTSEEKLNSFLAQLDKLEPGKTYLFVDHPGLRNEELIAVHHIGYEDVAGDRQGVTDLFTNPKVTEKIKSRGIKLIGYKDLK